jgi:hypothetical protein
MASTTQESRLATGFASFGRLLVRLLAYYLVTYPTSQT